MQIRYGKRLYVMFTTKTVWRQCENCSPKSIEKLFPFKDANVIIEYFQWETVMVKRNGKKKITEQPKK